MDFDLFKGIIDESSRYGARSFSLHLFGEPLLYPKILESIEYIKRRNRKNTVILTTNGTLLNRMVDGIISANPDLILWSWRREAKFTKETKEKLRKWGKFRVRFIEEITEEEAYKEWADWKNVEGRKLHNYGGNIGTKSQLPFTTIKRWPCYHLWLAPAVAWNGNFLICCSDPHQKEVLGNVKNETVHSMWNSNKLEMIRNSHLVGQYKGICANCDVWKSYPSIF